MNGIYTSTVSRDTLDESPEAYRPMEELKEEMRDTVRVLHHLKPIYNFKAKE